MFRQTISRLLSILIVAMLLFGIVAPAILATETTLTFPAPGAVVVH